MSHVVGEEVMCFVFGVIVAVFLCLSVALCRIDDQVSVLMIPVASLLFQDFICTCVCVCARVCLLVLVNISTYWHQCDTTLSSSKVFSIALNYV